MTGIVYARLRIMLLIINRNICISIKTYSTATDWLIPSLISQTLQSNYSGLQDK